MMQYCHLCTPKGFLDTINTVTGDSYEVQVLFCSSMAGFYPATLAFEFKLDLQTSAAFYTVCFIEAQLTSVGVFPKIMDGVRPEGYHRSLNTLLNIQKM